MKFSLFALSLLASASAIELTADNYDEMTAGKTVFLKFFAPWCGHCKKLKPDWDKLMDEFNDSTTQLVADVDCTAEGKPLCDANGVRGYPTLKWGDPAALEDYQGGRDLKTLKTFVKDKLVPMCSPANLDLCDDDKKAEIKKFMDMSDDDLDKLVEGKEKEMADAEAEFKTFVEGLQETYQEGMKKKDDTLDAIKESGLGLMKAVKIAKKKKGGKDEL
ncbi:disulfide-isomerase-like protein EhSep2 [Seminavis robusta]|uniref:Disulfide-isomerase-like protein EhSep2 n=1 Tax=Seminavis robusta TaxID=568900 RepID=A0A9N8DYG4_9STRA|nr:disulfide-isomerase-like protein EhSep2 [Seminavis robusta]|eukprot:Sro446_g144770.1 disulfide-isomerase-like protein EhSep2 (218) ;mRNA; r:58804-59559